MEKKHKEAKQCSQCGKIYLISGEIEIILKSNQSPYEKKIALFNFVKNLEVGELKPDKEERINYLLQSRLYSELARQSMRNYKEKTSEIFSKEK